MERPDRVVIVGVGLIGGSIGLAVRRRRPDATILGVDSDSSSLDAAVRLGVIDRGSDEIDPSISGAPVVLICTPVSRVADLAVRAAHAGGPGVLVSDSGSTKAGIVGAVGLDPIARARFVAAHPIAGAERGGVVNARADLFDGSTCVLTPAADTPPEILDRARSFWSSIGCRVATMDAEEHDRAVASTSHLPHAVAVALAASIPGRYVDQGLAGGAYRDGTRVAGSSPRLWSEILLANRPHVLDALDRFGEGLSALRSALEASDAPAIASIWASAQAEHRPQPAPRQDR